MGLPIQSAGVSRAVFPTPVRAGLVPARVIGLAPRFGLGRVGPIVDGGGRLGFSCGRLTCDCSGDDDCNDMFSSGVCGDIALCDEAGGEVSCWCFRW